MTVPQPAAEPAPLTATLVLEIRAGEVSSADMRVEMTVDRRDRSSAATVCAASTTLPFLDGAFDAATLTCPLGWFDGIPGERAAREIERVVRPAGSYAIRVRGVQSRSSRRRLERALGRSGLEPEATEANGDSLTVHGIRQSGVSAETWRRLGDGSQATAWNDSMFEFQQTPYDPRTIAGRIFLKRVRWIADVVGEHPGRVLEVGCEAGGLLRQLSSGPRIVGLDLSRAALKSARAAMARRDIALVHADATLPLPFRSRSFDFVIASEVLEHCRSPHRVIAGMHSVLKDDGRAIISVPNERRYLRWKRWLRRLPFARYVLRGIEEGPAAWHIHHDFDRRKLAALVEGFFVLERETSIVGATLISVLRKVSRLPARG
jgi:SAM-dependent methyltransferase